MDSVLFEHAEQGRNWVMKLLLAIGVAFVFFGILGGAPWFWYLGAGLFVLMVGWRVLANSPSGSRLTPQLLRVYAGGWQREMPLREINKVVLKDWVDGPPDVAAILKGGESVSIPIQCIGRSRTFVAALELAGIAIDRQ